MPNRFNEAPELKRLREQAEAELSQRQPEVATASQAETQRLLHELQVHQVELELQNEELCRSHVELQAERDKYAVLYDLAPVGYVTLDTTGTILAANLTAAALLGVERGALLHTPLARFLVCDDQDTFYLHRRQVFEVDTHQTCDLRLLRLDGTVLVMSLESRKVQDVAGQGQQCFTMLSDITARKQAEEALHRLNTELEQRVTERTVSLRQTNAQLEAEIAERQRTEEALQHQRDWLDVTLASIGDGVITTDTRGTITFLNPEAARLTGWSVADALGQPLDAVFHIVHERTRQPTDTPVAQVLRGRVVVDLANHMLLLARDAREYVIADSSAPIYSPDGTLYGVVLIFRDITNSRRLEMQVQQAQKMEAIGTLAGGIAHEFNNMLGVILGFADLTQYAVPHSSEAWKNLQQILVAGRQAKDMIQQILAFSRHTETERITLYPHVQVQETLRLLQASLPATIELRQHCANNVGTILADATQLQQVVMNLCVNAEQAMRERGGVLEVRVDAVDVETTLATTHAELHPGPYIRLSVQDTGPGIAPHLIARIFEPFFTTKEVGEGTGMGLAVVHGIVTSHGGAMTVESTLGQGTVFMVYLPRIDAEPHRDAPQQETLPQGSERVLVVDDEEALTLLAHQMLTYLGYHVQCFTNGAEALAAFRATPEAFDVIITDQTMPGMTGEVLAHALRQVRPDIPVILFTGFSHVIDAARAHAMGIDAFVMKPVTMCDLAVAMRKVLDQRHGRST